MSAKDWDAIQEIQKDAAQKKFDALLVFMFDRLDRKEDGTPFVVEWFIQNGIEVWSAEEGQQRFDNHVDKLMNYISATGRRRGRASKLPSEPKPDWRKTEILLQSCVMAGINWCFQPIEKITLTNCLRTPGD